MNCDLGCFDILFIKGSVWEQMGGPFLVHLLTCPSYLSRRFISWSSIIATLLLCNAVLLGHVYLKLTSVLGLFIKGWLVVTFFHLSVHTVP